MKDQAPLSQYSKRLGEQSNFSLPIQANEGTEERLNVSLPPR